MKDARWMLAMAMAGEDGMYWDAMDYFVQESYLSHAQFQLDDAEDPDLVKRLAQKFRSGE